MSIREFGKLCPVVILIWVTSISAVSVTQVLGGQPVNASLYPQVVEVTSGSNSCTATIVGTRALLMAAHCIDSRDPLVTFTVQGHEYSAFGISSPLFVSSGHDMGVAVLFEGNLPITPASIGGRARVGDTISFLGFGSSSSVNGSLSIGTTTVAHLTEMEIISGSTGATLAEGDSGGPAFVDNGYAFTVLAVGSQSNAGSSEFTRTDSVESQALFSQVIRDYNLGICGVNVNCYY